jgi:hypothetical protein
MPEIDRPAALGPLGACITQAVSPENAEGVSKIS